MADREKVIKGLEICVDRVPGKYSCCDCPYEIDGNDCEINLTKDAITLLKEQEVVEPIPPTDESDLWRCGICGHQLFRCTHQRFCSYCGQAVKWE